MDRELKFFLKEWFDSYFTYKKLIHDEFHMKGVFIYFDSKVYLYYGDNNSGTRFTIKFSRDEISFCKNLVSIIKGYCTYNTQQIDGFITIEFNVIHNYTKGALEKEFICLK